MPHPSALPSRGHEAGAGAEARGLRAMRAAERLGPRGGGAERGGQALEAVAEAAVEAHKLHLGLKGCRKYFS